MAIQLLPEESSIRRIVQAIIQLAEGRHNAFGSSEDSNSATTKPIILTPNAALTVVAHPNCGLGSVILLSPRTANAAAAIPTTWVSSKIRGSFTLTHANNAQVDRIFDFTCTGG